MNKIGIYAGTFDPVTNGHLDIIRKASKVFNKVFVSVGVNPEKKGTWFDPQQRVQMIQQATRDIPNVHVTQFQGLLVNYAKAVGAKTIIRGLRGVSDFEYELQIGYANKSLEDDIDTVFFMPNVENSYISSSTFRAIYKETKTFESVKHLVPPSVEKRLLK